MQGINFKAFDLGGHEIARRVWKDYYAKVCLYVYVVRVLPCILHLSKLMDMSCRLPFARNASLDSLGVCAASTAFCTQVAETMFLCFAGGCAGFSGGCSGQGAVHGVQEGARCSAGR
jgi:hypothetical protein